MTLIRLSEKKSSCSYLVVILYGVYTNNFILFVILKLLFFTRSRAPKTKHMFTHMPILVKWFKLNRTLINNESHLNSVEMNCVSAFVIFVQTICVICIGNNNSSSQRWRIHPLKLVLLDYAHSFEIKTIVSLLREINQSINNVRVERWFEENKIKEHIWKHFIDYLKNIAQTHAGNAFGNSLIRKKSFTCLFR